MVYIVIYLVYLSDEWNLCFCLLRALLPPSSYD